MAREEKKHEGKHYEERKRARGGKMPEEMVEEMPQKRKRGGKVHGEKAGHRPDRRARGGAMGEPTTEAGKMSKPSFEGYMEPKDSHGQGRERD
jgi:hypothetical protein